MSKLDIVILAMVELVGVIVLVRLWLQRRHAILARMFWSFILLIPLLGLLMYWFLTGTEPDKNPDRMDSQADRDARSAAWLR